jgi:hypothetical protein
MSILPSYANLEPLLHQLFLIVCIMINDIRPTLRGEAFPQADGRKHP